MQELAEAEANEAFDLGQGPLLRVQLLRLGAADHVLLLTMHHIVSDGWSLGVLTEELVVLYEAYLAEEPSPLAELGIQYADYAVWQREWLQGEMLERELGYWREQSEGGAGSIGTAAGQTAAGGAELSRGVCAGAGGSGVDGGAEGGESPGEGDVVHEPAGGVSGVALAV